MLYVEEKEFSDQLALLKHFFSRRDFDVIVWLYPESTIEHLFGYTLVNGDEFEGLAVTKYEDSKIITKRTQRYPLSEVFLNKIENNKQEFEANCDSCVLYKSEIKDWHVASIGHEGMFIVNDDDEYIELSESGFSVSKTPPEWW